MRCLVALQKFLLIYVFYTHTFRLWPLDGVRAVRSGARSNSSSSCFYHSVVVVRVPCIGGVHLILIRSNFTPLDITVYSVRCVNSPMFEMDNGVVCFSAARRALRELVCTPAHTATQACKLCVDEWDEAADNLMCTITMTISVEHGSFWHSELLFVCVVSSSSHIQSFFFITDVL